MHPSIHASTGIMSSRALGTNAPPPPEGKIITSAMEISADLRAPLTEARVLRRGVCARPQRGGMSR